MKTQWSCLSAFKACFVIILAAVSFNASAGSMYVGNPTRPDIIWVPGHYRHGAWVEGYYIKYNKEVCCRDVMRIAEQCDSCGHCVEGHFYYPGWYNFDNHYRVKTCSNCG